MNASYKIALLAAFAVLAIVVSYYAFLAGPPAEPDPDPNTVLADANDNADPGNTPAPPANTNRPPRPTPQIPITPPPATPGNTPGNTPPATPGGTPPASPGNDITIGPQPGGDTLDTGTPGSPASPGTPGGEEPDTPETPTPRVPYPGATPGGTPRGPATPGTPGVTPGPGTETPRTPDTPRTPAVEPEPGPAAPRTYTVQPGDTLSAIAVKVFNDEAAWVDIAQANPSVDPLRLQPGQVLIMPSREVVEEAGEPAPPAPGQEQRYTIRPGDNLSRIAQRFYDDPEAWQVIYNRNRDKIGPTPDRLKAGMEIIIPPRYEGAN